MQQSQRDIGGGIKCAKSGRSCYRMSQLDSTRLWLFLFRSVAIFTGNSMTWKNFSESAVNVLKPITYSWETLSIGVSSAWKHFCTCWHWRLHFSIHLDRFRLSFNVHLLHSNLMHPYAVFILFHLSELPLVTVFKLLWVCAPSSHPHSLLHCIFLFLLIKCDSELYFLPIYDTSDAIWISTIALLYGQLTRVQSNFTDHPTRSDIPTESP